jgi:hypothetical protein
MAPLQVGYIASEVHFVIQGLLIFLEVWFGFGRMIFTDQVTSNSATICPLYGCGGIDSSQYGSTVWGSVDYFLLTWGITGLFTYIIVPFLFMLRVESKFLHGLNALCMGFFACVDFVRALYFWIIIAAGSCNWAWYCRAYGWYPFSPFFVILLSATVRVPLVLDHLWILYLMMQCGQVKKRTEDEVYRNVQFE